MMEGSLSEKRGTGVNDVAHTNGFLGERVKPFERLIDLTATDLHIASHKSML